MTVEELRQRHLDHLQADLPFTMYRRPAESKIQALFAKASCAVQDIDYQDSGFLVSPYDKSYPLLFFPFNSVEHRSADIETDTESSASSQKEDLSEGEDIKRHYKDLVQKAKDQIGLNILEKVVTSRRIEIPKSVNDPLDLFLKMADRYPKAMVYYWSHPGIGTWLGATPELLLRVFDDKVKTISLAATRSFLTDTEIDWSAKELEEQHIVTRFLKRELEPFSDAFEIIGPKSSRAGNLVHLKTEVIASLKHGTGRLGSIINALHPSPAICGVPRLEALHFLARNEDHSRAYYTGYLGELNKPGHSKTELYVNLRCLQLLSDSVYVYVGGGITAGSEPEKEWEETVQKSKTMLSLIAY